MLADNQGYLPLTDLNEGSFLYEKGFDGIKVPIISCAVKHDKM